MPNSVLNNFDHRDLFSFRSDEEIGPLSPLAVSLAAGFSGSLAAAASHGFDTAKSRSQCIVLPKVCCLTRFQSSVFDHLHDILLYEISTQIPKCSKMILGGQFMWQNMLQVFDSLLIASILHICKVKHHKKSLSWAYPCCGMSWCVGQASMVNSTYWP